MHIDLVDDPSSILNTDTLCIAICEGAGAPPADLPPTVRESVASLMASGEATGEFKQIVQTRDGGRRIYVVGLGPREDVGPEKIRTAAAVAVRLANSTKGVQEKSLGWLLPDTASRAGSAQALVEGAILADYRFDRYKEDSDSPRIRKLTLLGDADTASAVREGEILATAQNKARDLQNAPANDADPAFLARRAMEIAEDSVVTTTVLGRDEISKAGMGGILAVGSGSAKEQQLIVMRYDGGSGPPIAFVGKGVTFDSGGISIKPSAKMHEMKMDMSGGATVIEALSAAARLELPVNLLGIVPAVENMPGSHAYRPGDILRMYGGKTVEVTNTDAEGRLVLADAITYAVELGAERIIDIATLTGAIVVALGSSFAGLVSNDDDLAEAITGAGLDTGELVWRLPRHDEYFELMKSKCADMMNASDQRKAGSLNAAAFLERFVGDRPWAHLDIAGTAWDVGREYVGKGASGFGVRLMVETAKRLASA